ncbi:hypothetical protein C4577_04135 [Candidatus Parcubacteria bacterium]|nr:MAG: hypothetical protein C4577_04135 [Candidatus Parcubacteria bacterium]
MSNNIVRARVGIEGTRTLLQHQFGPDSMPLEKQERTGVAGNDPQEWKKSCMVNSDGQLYLPGTYIFSCLKNGSKRTKKGKGSVQSDLVATLQVEEDIVLLNRFKPNNNELQFHQRLVPEDESVDVFIYVTSVRNPATRGRNVRYRLATRPGWKCEFTLSWDKTVVPRETMKAILRDSGTFGGLGDGITIGCGRFDVISYVELTEKEVQNEVLEKMEKVSKMQPI